MAIRKVNTNVKEGLEQLELNFKTSVNAVDFINDNEVPEGASLTVPGQSMSVREIMSRYASGLSPTGVKVPIWEDENPLPNPDNMDLVDRQEFAIEAQAELDEIARIKAGEPAPEVIPPTLPPSDTERPVGTS